MHLRVVACAWSLDNSTVTSFSHLLNNPVTALHVVGQVDVQLLPLIKFFVTEVAGAELFAS